MLFRKNIEKMCCYCVHCTALDAHALLCSKKGVRSPEAHCRKFKYDPCKRIPSKPKALDFEKYKQYDYSL